MTHQEIEQQDVAERYVRSQLSPEQRTAFEEHFFACDECFAQLQATQRFIAGIRDVAASGLLARSPSRSFERTASLWPTWLRPAYVLTAAALLLVTMGTGWLLFRRNARVDNELARQQPPQIEQAPKPNLNQPDKQLPGDSGTLATKENQPERSAKTPVPRRRSSSGGPAANREDLVRTPNIPSVETGSEETAVADETRSTTGKTAGISLVAVKQVYVELLGDDAATGELRGLLIRELKSSQRLATRDNREGTDAVLRASIRQLVAGKTKSQKSDRVLITVRLISFNGEVLWPRKGKGQEARYTGSLKSLAHRIVMDLIAEINKAER
jgi:hypothetical protein